MYTGRAYWPNCTMDPETKRFAHLADAINWVFEQMAGHDHTTIEVTADALSLIRVWGQPMPNGQDWP